MGYGRPARNGNQLDYVAGGCRKRTVASDKLGVFGYLEDSEPDGVRCCSLSMTAAGLVIRYPHVISSV